MHEMHILFQVLNEKKLEPEILNFQNSMATGTLFMIKVS